MRTDQDHGPRRERGGEESLWGRARGGRARGGHAHPGHARGGSEDGTGERASTSRQVGRRAAVLPVSALAASAGLLVGLPILGPASVSGAALAPSRSVSSARAQSASHSVVVRTAQVPNVGTVLTTSSGLTLYRFTVDPKGKATCTGACAQVWPPYLAAKGARVVGPSGVTGFSLIAVGGGHWQVAYHGEALYRYAPDTAKGQAKGQGLQHLWYAVTKSGQSPAGTVSASGGASGGSGGQGRGATPTTPPTMAPTTTPTTASHASGGYGY